MEHRYGDKRRPACIVQLLQVRVQVLALQVRQLNRPALLCGAPDQRVVQADMGPAQGIDERGTGAVRGPDDERLLGIVVLEDRPAVGTRERHRLHDDRRKHLVGVEAGAHGLPDLAQRLQLGDLLAELPLAGFQGPCRRTCRMAIAA